ncbi:hypothetical protein ROZALSC1DRAFT_31763, partial [Rozella allomycis CSF55]
VTAESNSGEYTAKLDVFKSNFKLTGYSSGFKFYPGLYWAHMNKEVRKYQRRQAIKALESQNKALKANVKRKDKERKRFLSAKIEAMNSKIAMADKYITKMKQLKEREEALLKKELLLENGLLMAKCARSYYRKRLFEYCPSTRNIFNA